MNDIWRMCQTKIHGADALSYDTPQRLYVLANARTLCQKLLVHGPSWAASAGTGPSALPLAIAKHCTYSLRW